MDNSITFIKMAQRPHRGHSDITMTQTIAQRVHCGPLAIQCPTFSTAIFLSMFKKIATDAWPQRPAPTVCGNVTTATTSLQTTPIYVPTSQRLHRSLIRSNRCTVFHSIRRCGKQALGFSIFSMTQQELDAAVAYHIEGVYPALNNEK